MTVSSKNGERNTWQAFCFTWVFSIIFAHPSSIVSLLLIMQSFDLILLGCIYNTLSLFSLMWFIAMGCLGCGNKNTPTPTINCGLWMVEITGICRQKLSIVIIARSGRWRSFQVSKFILPLSLKKKKKSLFMLILPKRSNFNKTRFLIC